MSGRKQHFIPQSILRGFSRQGMGAKRQVVVYTRDRGIFTAATDGVGAERNFYSELAVDGDSPTLDDNITEFETPLADVLRNFRALPHGALVDIQEAATFVTHLTVRNDHFRKTLSSGGSAIFDGLQASMSVEHTAKALLGLSNDSPSGPILEALENLMTEHSTALSAIGMSNEKFIEFAFDAAKANFSKLHIDLIELMRAEFASFDSRKMLEIAASGQRRTLEKDLSPKGWIERLSKMVWRISHCDLSIVLPDCVSVAVTQAGEALPMLLPENETIQFVLVPIASDRLLVGSRGEADSVPSLDLNAAFAACSWDFFVGNERNHDWVRLSETIRSGVKRQMDEAVSEVLRDSLRQRARP